MGGDGVRRFGGAGDREKLVIEPSTPTRNKDKWENAAATSKQVSQVPVVCLFFALHEVACCRLRDEQGRKRRRNSGT